MTWGSLVLASTISRDVTLRGSDLVVEPNTFLLFIFLLLAGKSIVDSLHRAVESKELVQLMVQPVSPAQVAFGKFLGVLFSNLTIVAFGVGLMAAIQLSSFYTTPEHPLTITGPMPDGSGNSWWDGYGITHLQILDTIFLAITASCMGFTYSILNSLPTKKRIAGLIVYSQLVSAIFIIMRWNQDFRSDTGPIITPMQETLALLLITLVSFGVLYPTVRYLFFEAWLKETTGKRAMWFQKRSWGGLGWLGRLFSPRMTQLIKKELIINVQKKEIVGNIIAILGLSALWSGDGRR